MNNIKINFHLELLSDDELARILMFSDRDRKENSEAKRVYCLCVKEINRRIENDIEI